MKALSIRKLKGIKAGDWVWIKGIKGDDTLINLYENGAYYQVAAVSSEYKDSNFEAVSMFPAFRTILNYADYGKTWFAYKNREQAECKGKLIELPRIIHPNELEWFVQYQYESGVIDYEIFYSLEQAEQKLKELRNIDG